jgi:hypothetical protein
VEQAQEPPGEGGECAFGPRLNNTDACPGGPVGYRDLSVYGAADPLGACEAACCAWEACTAWVVRHFSGRDLNCTDTLCCWLKPSCEPSETSPVGGATAAFKAAAPPGPPLPALARGYSIVLNASDSTLGVVRVAAGGAGVVLGTFPLSSLENGLVLGAWNMLRVVAVVVAAAGGGDALTLSVFFNPMYPETGFAGNSSDAFRTPVKLAPRLMVRDDDPLAPGAIALLAGGREARADYIAALPLSVL